MATASTHTLLQRTSLTTSASTVTFSNIPQSGYTDLKVVINARTSRPTNVYGTVGISFNGVTTNLSSKLLQGDGSTAASYSYSTSIPIDLVGQGATSNTFGSAEFYIPNYTGSNYKSVIIDGVGENNATLIYSNLSIGLWSSTSAITSIKFDAGIYSFDPYSTFSLYATSAVGTTPGTPKATGGDIIKTDGTYWYHSFLSTGVFTPSSTLSCDYLVVAGGGAGGTGQQGGQNSGGGGAGGFRTGTGLSLSATNYTVTVGAGGARNTIDYGKGGNGTNSILSTISATGGGGGGGSPTGLNVAQTGGSGGGGAINASGAAGNAGSYSPVEGYAGGNGTNPNAGGGGGSSAAGTTASGSAGGGGAGGAGTANSYSGSSVTYAGGGGGASDSGSGGAGGSGGGGAGAAGSSSSAVAGTPNLGGGGGGGSAGTTGTYTYGGNGGSGIVIIRYAV